MSPSSPVEAWPRLDTSKHSEVLEGSRSFKGGKRSKDYNFFRCPEDEEWYYAEPNARSDEISAALDRARMWITDIEQTPDPASDTWQRSADRLCETLQHAEGYFAPMATKLDHFTRQGGAMQAADRHCRTGLMHEDPAVLAVDRE